MRDSEPWTFEAVQALRALARDRVPLDAISLHLKRPPEQVRAKLAELGLAVPLGPDDDRPSE